MTLFAEAQRLVGCVSRLNLFRTERVRASRRSRALNNQIACLALVPYSTAETSSTLTAPENVTQTQGSAAERIPCTLASYWDNKLMNLRDLPECNEQNIDQVWGNQLVSSKRHWSNISSSREQFMTCFNRCLNDGSMLDRLIEIENINSILSHPSAGEESKHHIESKHRQNSPLTKVQGVNPPIDIEMTRMSIKECRDFSGLLGGHDSLECSDGISDFIASSSLVFCDSDSTNGSLSEVNAESDDRLPSEEELRKVRDILNHHFPRFFVVPPDFSLFHCDIVFENNFEEKPFVTQGIGPYVHYMSKKRYICNVGFVKAYMHILKATMHEEDGTIRIRWRAGGVGSWKIFTFLKYGLSQKKEFLDGESEWYDGFSVFYVEPKTTLIYKHRVDKVIPEDLPVREKQPSLIDRLRRRLNPGVAAIP